MSITYDSEHPDLTRGVDKEPVQQASVYLALSEEERAKGFVRPVRTSYIHVGLAEPDPPLEDFSAEMLAEKPWLVNTPYVKWQPTPDHPTSIGRYWTQEEVDKIGKGCGVVTTMGRVLAETYAREPGFYGATYCCGCSMHLPVGVMGEFVWDGTDERVGT